METFPIMLRVAGRLSVVVGGGAVGLRKVRSLLQVGAKVRLVEPDPPSDDSLSPVELVRAPYDASQLRGAALVFACTNDADINGRIALDARAAGALVNAVDQPEDCDFYSPAVVRDGPITIAIGTDGLAPAVAGQLKQTLAEALPEKIGAFATALGEARIELHNSELDGKTRSQILKSLARCEVYEDFLARGRSAVFDALQRLREREGEA